MEELGSSFSREDNNMIMNKMRSSKGKLPLFCSSNSSTSSLSFSSSSRQHNTQSIAALPQMPIYENKHRRQVGSSNYNWLGNNYHCEPEPEGDTSGSFRFNGTAAASNLDLMDIEEDSRRESAAFVHVMEKEHMFDKVVTPSDVGKLNRLVIPKQHAEKYFPLDSSSKDKGLLLNFEDRNGKAWRFRYSHWNSSQSYVMTKGWSRFVKDKKLDAGDIVSFQRGVGDSGKDCLYIDWRRRPPDAFDPTIATSHQYYHHSYQQTFSSIPWSPLLMRPQPTSQLLPRDHLHLSKPPPNINAYDSGGGSYGYGPYYGNGQSNYSNLVKINPCSSSLRSTFYNMRSAAAAPAPSPQQQTLMGMFQWQQEAGGVAESMAYKSVPVVQGKAAAKRLRLFGVNMVCPITESNECDVLPSNTIPPHATPLQQQQLTQQLSSYHTQDELRLYGATPLLQIPSSDLFNKKKPSVSQNLDI